MGTDGIDIDADEVERLRAWAFILVGRWREARREARHFESLPDTFPKNDRFVGRYERADALEDEAVEAIKAYARAAGHARRIGQTILPATAPFLVEGDTLIVVVSSSDLGITDHFGSPAADEVHPDWFECVAEIRLVDALMPPGWRDPPFT